ncbi:magnesium chelatase domain-containing protein [Actinomadura flavalba]|uniref:magnesium chelatase domain-containing protein n=1 Tax=Actinomadura flavalba TaxID=1120938 RepID=UPI00039D754D|nr:magnesium chelatase domain-containing protein [Actinomadura flavalba]
MTVFSPPCTTAASLHPPRAVSVALLPASFPERDTGLDLPIALALLAVHKSLNLTDLTTTAFIGELRLHGALRPIHGVAARLTALATAGCTTVVIPADNANETSLPPGGPTIVPARDLNDVVQWITTTNRAHDSSKRTPHG